MSLRVGGQIALAVEPIINPHSLKIIGWWCQADTPGPLVLLSEHVRDFVSGGLAVDDHDDLSEPQDLVRYREVLEIHFKLIDKLVKTKHQKLGKVNDFSYNDGMFVQKLYVARPLHKVLATDSTLLIDRQQILEVTDQYILVKGSEIRATETDLAADTALAA